METKVLIALSTDATELTTLCSQAENEREKQLYNKQIKKIPSYSLSEDGRPQPNQ
jgi:hypothetical protein